MPSRLLPSAAFVASLLLLGSAVGAQTQPEEVQTEEVQPEVPEAERLLEEIERLRSGYRALEKEKRKIEGEERLIVALQMRKQLFEFMRQVDKLVALVVRQREEGVKRRPA